MSITHYIINSIVLALDIYLNNQLVLSLSSCYWPFFVSLHPKNLQALLKNGIAFATYQFRNELNSHFWMLHTHTKVTFSYYKLKNGISCSKFAYLSLIFCNIMRIRYISTDLVKIWYRG